MQVNGKKCLVGLCAVLMACASASAVVTGQWDFNGDLNATVGTALQYGDATTQAGTGFGLTSGLGLPAVQAITAGGVAVGAPVDANVMRFPKTGGASEGYKMLPGAPANGSFSGGDVNQYTILFDVYYPAASSNKYRALFQTSATNANDADLFIGDGSTSPNANGIGISGQYDGVIEADKWYRIGLVVNLDAPNGVPTYLKYINGNLVGSQIIKDSRFAPWSAESGNPSWIFADNDGETELGYVDMVRFYDSALSTDDMAALGGIRNVPEPATLGLLAIGGLALLRRRR